MRRPALTYLSLVSLAAAAMAISACGGQIGQNELGLSSPTATRQPVATVGSPTPTATVRAFPTPTPDVANQPGDLPVGTPTFSAPAGLRTPTPGPQATPTPSVSIDPTPTPVPGVTVTPTPGTISTPVATPTPTPVPTAVAYGPVNGEMEHLSNENGLEAEQFPTGAIVRDFLVSASFDNPYPADRKDWNYGYWLRVTSRPGTFWTQGVPFPGRIYTGLMIVVDSRGDWALFHRELTSATQGQSIIDTPIATGEISLINRLESESNRVAVAAFGERGWLLVNGNLVAELDFSMIAEAGEVIAVTGVSDDDEYAGATTKFTGLEVTQAADGSASADSGLLQPFATSGLTPDASVIGDFVFETEISVPTPLFSGPWSWALEVECEGKTIRLVVNSARQVQMFLEADGQGRVTTVDTTLSSVKIGTNDPNSVQIAVIGDSLGIMVNGFALPSITLDNEDARHITMMAYVQGEAGSDERIITHDETRVWRVGE